MKEQERSQLVVYGEKETWRESFQGLFSNFFQFAGWQAKKEEKPLQEIALEGENERERFSDAFKRFGKGNIDKRQALSLLFAIVGKEKLEKADGSKVGSIMDATYRRLALQEAPDKGGGEERFQFLNDMRKKANEAILDLGVL